ncbi:natural killer cell receptor 2B4-like isoform X1 [Cyprinus carpio]|uniref:Natural killer cell receptor 2B4-like isoform X1 n=1 Tax=Cyprinus carpio TaxID=7962 RepID=A0A9Q9VPB7_CYPCA|nr:natural killer cell receptor 2B4-like isoform X1 [Cyprinus carpio]
MSETFIFICLCSWSLAGVFGDEVKSVSVMEGDSVTLNTNDTDIQKNDRILWKFGHNNFLITQINRKNNKSTFYDDIADGRFRDRLQLDHQTGSLTITNTTITDSGLYKVTSTSTQKLFNTFSLTVYAHLPVPVISSNASQCSSSSSSSSQQNCSLVCSVVNVGHVTLSWYKGHSLLSSISVSDLSISLSLPLEVEYQDKNTYSCVLNNPISNQTQHLDITQLCHTCAEHGLIISYTVLISAAAAAGSLLIVAALMIFCIFRKHKKVNQEDTTRVEEITYSEITFNKRKAQKSRDKEETEVVYAGIAGRC